MDLISLNTAVALTGLTKRTLWRYIDSGRLTAHSSGKSGDKTRVRLHDIRPLARLTLEPAHDTLILDADQGDPAAQCDLALLLLDADRPTQATAWLTCAAKQYYPDAMCLLGRAYLTGTGLEPNLETGLAWLHRAAAKGSPIAQALSDWLQSQPGQTTLNAQNPTALDTALDAIERQTLINALNATAGTS